ncbi:hypothetical protein ABPG75_012075 [Micractinium tetrahymenae]
MQGLALLAAAGGRFGRRRRGGSGQAPFSSQNTPCVDQQGQHPSGPGVEPAAQAPSPDLVAWLPPGFAFSMNQGSRKSAPSVIQSSVDPAAGREREAPLLLPASLVSPEALCSHPEAFEARRRVRG